MATRSFQVGPIRCSIEVEPALAASLGRVFEQVRSIDTPVRRLSLELSLARGPAERRSELPRVPRFAPRAGGLIDRSQGWDAELSLDGPDIAARFSLVDASAFGHEHAATLDRLNVGAALRVSLGLAAPSADALLLHAAALAHAGRALVFLGESGHGKTTMTRRLPGWRLLADDAVLVWREGRTWFASGTPLPGKEGLARELARVPLAGLHFLEPHHPTLALTRLTRGDAMSQALARLLWFAEPTPQLLELVADLAESVPAWRLASDLSHDVGPTLVSNAAAARLPEVA